MAEIDDVLAERGKTHGDWKGQSYAAADIRNAIQKWDTQGLPAWKIEALLMIGFKISRILQGDSNCREHWLDLAGYATLVADYLKPAPPASDYCDQTRATRCERQNC